MGKYGPGDDLAMMQDPMEWPLVIQLPLKLPPATGGFGWPEHGFLYCPIGCALPSPVVYRAGVYAVQSGQLLADLPQTQYDSFQAILDAGWVVD